MPEIKVFREKFKANKKITILAELIEEYSNLVIAYEKLLEIDMKLVASKIKIEKEDYAKWIGKYKKYYSNMLSLLINDKFQFEIRYPLANAAVEQDLVKYITETLFGVDDFVMESFGVIKGIKYSADVERDEQVVVVTYVLNIEGEEYAQAI